jgi:hypothetical protein
MTPAHQDITVRQSVFPAQLPGRYAALFRFSTVLNFHQLRFAASLTVLDIAPKSNIYFKSLAFWAVLNAFYLGNSVVPFRNDASALMPNDSPLPVSVVFSYI